MRDLQSFHERVKSGDLAGVKEALRNDPDLLDAKNSHGQSAFLMAKYYRREQVAAYLLSLHPQLDFFSACAAGRTAEVLEQIDRDGTLLEARNPDGWSPLHLVAFFGHTELAKGLLNRGANVDGRSGNALQNTPLHAAAAGGSIDVMRLLLENGADVNARQQPGGWTALHTASRRETGRWWSYWLRMALTCTCGRTTDRRRSIWRLRTDGKRSSICSRSEERSSHSAHAGDEARRIAARHASGVCLRGLGRGIRSSAGAGAGPQRHTGADQQGI